MDIATAEPLLASLCAASERAVAPVGEPEPVVLDTDEVVASDELVAASADTKTSAKGLVAAFVVAVAEDSAAAVVVGTVAHTDGLQAVLPAVAPAVEPYSGSDFAPSALRIAVKFVEGVG